MKATAKLFTNGRSQAVRIPKALEFQGIRETSFNPDKASTRTHAISG